MRESPHVQLTAEQDKRETVICIMWASVVVFGMLALVVHGLAFLSWTEPTKVEVYRNRMMDNNIKALRQDFNNHTHRYSDGKIKQGTAR